MKKRILVLATGNIYERRGLFNAVIGRTKHLKEICDYEVDMLLLSTYKPWYVRLLRNTKKRPRPNEFEADGIHMRIDWCRSSLFDYMMNVILHKGVFFKKLHNRKLVRKLNGYDFIIAHSFECGALAKMAKERFGTPYSITWHGSDIHSEPFNNPSAFNATKVIIEDADINFFVSKALLNTSERITTQGNKQVLYNGHHTAFRRYSDEEREALRKKYNVEGKKVVVFAGNFFAVKNILTIPLIFRSIVNKMENVECWMIGGGKYFNRVKRMVKDLPVRLWGNQEPEVMPDFLNVADVLILPSTNEGLPLSVVEGLACGCNVVGSLAGGIPEVIGEDNCVDLNDPQFVDKFADKVIAYLQAVPHIEQPLKPEFDWNITAKHELDILNREGCRMKNVLVLTKIYPAPDLEKEETPVVHYFAREWIKMGYNVRVIHYPTNFPKIVMWGISFFKNWLSTILGMTVRAYQTDEKEYVIDHVQVKRIPLLKYWLHSASPKSEINKAYKKTIRYLHAQHFTPDVIISHCAHPQLEIMDGLKREYGCKTCYVAHGDSVVFDRIHSLKQAQKLIDNIDLVGFRSASIREAICKRFSYNRPSFLCYSGVPEKYIPEHPVERNFDKVQNFVFVGTLIKRKYPAEIIPALVKAYSKEKFNISYIGRGFESSRINKFAKKLKVQKNVHQLGYISRDEVVKQLQTNDVFVMISRSETFGLVYLEAMAQGLIVVASRKEGFDGIIEHGKNGFLCEAGNIDELAEIIREIRCMSPNYLQEISNNAIETARQLTDQKAAKAYIEKVMEYCDSLPNASLRDDR